eukprot:TRINITY_DN6147_c1_g1_i1.p1 TRINITY_DN6147_c1_g1~~TRINITY_DN6147_c1_g1_i1.p1  ORF type:complete len:698 (+),score=194.98 TRINITY_DN6147_c1_g1_i1:121-2214(+)
MLRQQPPLHAMGWQAIRYEPLGRLLAWYLIVWSLLPGVSSSSPDEDIGAPPRFLELSTATTTTTMTLYTWFVGRWSECSGTCSSGTRTREVYCQRACSLYRCPEADTFLCGGDPEPTKEACTSAEVLSDACLQKDAVVDGTIGFFVDEATSFVREPDSARVIGDALYSLLDSNGLMRSTVSVILTQTITRLLGAGQLPSAGGVADRGGRRALQGGTVTASYTVIVPSGSPTALLGEVTTTLETRQLPQVTAAVETALATESRLMLYSVSLTSFGVGDSHSITTQQAASTASTSSSATTSSEPAADDNSTDYECAYGQATGCVADGFAQEGCGEDCNCCVLKADAASTTTRAGFFQNRADDFVAPADEAADATPLIIAAAGSVVLGCILSGSIGVLIWRSCSKPAAPEGSIKKKKKKRKRSRISPEEDEDDAESFTTSASTEFMDSDEEWEGIRREGFERAPGFEEEDAPEDGVRRKDSRKMRHAATAPDLERGARSSRKEKHGRRHSEAFDEKDPNNETWHAGISEDFHKRKAASKIGKPARSHQEKDEEQPPRKKQEKDEAKKDKKSKEKDEQKPTKGTAAPPRSTDVPGAEPSSSTSGAAGGASTQSEKEHRPAAEAPAAPAPVPVDPAAQAIADVIAEVDKELDMSMGKDMEERKKVFKALQLKWHPDKNPEDAEKASEVFKHLMKRRAGYMAT